MPLAVRDRDKEILPALLDVPASAGDGFVDADLLGRLGRSGRPSGNKHQGRAQRRQHEGRGGERGPGNPTKGLPGHPAFPHDLREQRLLKRPGCSFPAQLRRRLDASEEYSRIGAVQVAVQMALQHFVVAHPRTVLRRRSTQSRRISRMRWEQPVDGNPGLFPIRAAMEEGSRPSSYRRETTCFAPSWSSARQRRSASLRGSGSRPARASSNAVEAVKEGIVEHYPAAFPELLAQFVPGDRAGPGREIAAVLEVRGFLHDDQADFLEEVLHGMVVGKRAVEVGQHLVAVPEHQAGDRRGITDQILIHERRSPPSSEKMLFPVEEHTADRPRDGGLAPRLFQRRFRNFSISPSVSQALPGTWPGPEKRCSLPPG